MYQPMQFKNEVVHPGAMHVIQLHCKAEFSAQVYVAAAYAGLTGTIRVTSPSITFTGIFNIGSPGCGLFMVTLEVIFVKLG